MTIFKDLYNYRELLKTNVKKEIRGKYKGSWLGVIWTFLNPLLMLAVYAFVFPYILRVEVENYTIFMIVALIPWTLTFPDSVYAVQFRNAFINLSSLCAAYTEIQTHIIKIAVVKKFHGIRATIINIV